MKIFEELREKSRKLREKIPNFIDIKDIKYLSFYIASILIITIVLLIYLFVSQPPELSTLYLFIYYIIVIGFILIIIANIFIYKNIYKFTQLNNYIYLFYLFFDLLPLIILIVTTISLITLNFYYTKKIDSNSLTDIFYTFNKVYLLNIIFQFIIYISMIRIDINKSINIFRGINLLLAILNIIFTILIWQQPLYFSTDG